MSEIPAEVDSAVKSRFEVRDKFILPDGGIEYKVVYTPESKGRFVDLSAQLGGLGYSAWLRGSREDCTLQVLKKQPVKPSASRIPVIMALLTVGMVVIFALFELQVYDVFAPSIPYYVVFISFVACMVAVLAAHEFGRRYVSERRGSPITVPYFIPGFPLLTAFLPSLGIISRPRSPHLNRDVAFDCAIAGPVAILSISILFYIVSEFASVQSTVPMVAGVLQRGQFQVQVYSQSVIQMLIDGIYSLAVPGPTGGYVKLSPISDAASVGLFLAFLSLLPVAYFDGGQAVAGIVRPAIFRAASYVSGLCLMAIDFPNYWVMGLFVFTLTLLAGSRGAEGPLYDEVSPASSSRRTVYVLLLLVGLCCLPIPQNFASIPLG